MKLTTRQWEIGLLVGKGYTNKEIARQLGLTEATVKCHISKIFGKLNISRRGAVNDAMERSRQRFGRPM